MKFTLHVVYFSSLISLRVVNCRIYVSQNECCEDLFLHGEVYAERCISYKMSLLA